MTLGRARHQSSIARERLMWKRAFEFPRQYARAFPRDFTFVRRAVHRIRPHFGHGQSQTKGITKLNPIQQEDIVHQRTQPEASHHRVHPQHFGILMVIYRRYAMLLHERDERMKEVTEDSSPRTQIGSVGREAINDYASRLELFD